VRWSTRTTDNASRTSSGSARRSSSTTTPQASLRVFTPAAELPLAGHPLVGAAWLLLGEPAAPTVLELRPPGGLVRSWADANDRTWIEAPLGTLPDWTLVQLGSPAAIEGLSGPLQPDHDHVVYWAFIETGVLRVRCFAPRFGIAEDEATGSAALLLTALLEQPIEIRQGKALCCAHARLTPAGRPLVAWSSKTSRSTSWHSHRLTDDSRTACL